MRILLTLFAVAALVFVSISTSSCSTAAGLGRDMQTLGHALENAAN